MRSITSEHMGANELIERAQNNCAAANLVGERRQT
jgi:hypothetical protein